MLVLGPPNENLLRAPKRLWSALHEGTKPQTETKTEQDCLPNHGCASSWGWQGFRHVLSSQGCLDIQLCNSQEVVKYRGQRYDLTHSCCCGNKCNVTPKVNASLIVSLWFKTSPDNLLSALMKTVLLLAYWFGSFGGGSVELGGYSPISWSVQQ
uniref:Activin types I and II receptor domain-containing protein n=1 Tax=Poecilia reticulata TaxID=8081 RepID=A0A3P9PRY5_POERE